MALLNVSPPQPLAQLIELLHTHCGQLTRERATLQQTGSSFTHRYGPTDTHLQWQVNMVQGQKESILWDLVFQAKSSAVNLFSKASNSAHETIISMDPMAIKQDTIFHWESLHSLAVLQRGGEGMNPH